MAAKNYSKGEFIDYVAVKTGAGKAYTQKMLDSITDAIVSIVGKEKGEVNIPGFGKFRAATTKAKTARNPHSGEPVQVPAGHRVSFKAGKNFKDAVNPKKK